MPLVSLQQGGSFSSVRRGHCRLTVWNERLIFWGSGWKILPIVVVFRSERRTKKNRLGSGPEAESKELSDLSDVKFTKNVGNEQGASWRVARIVTREEKDQRLPGFGGMPIFGTKIVREVSESRIDEHGELQHRVRRTESMSGAIHHEANGRAVLVPKRTAYVIPAVAVRRPVLSSRRPSGHAPRTARHSTRSTAASNSPGESDDSGGDSDGSDGPDLPAPLPLIGGNLRNEFRNDNSHKHENNNLIDLLNRLTLGCAGLLAAVVMSLVLGCSR